MILSEKFVNFSVILHEMAEILKIGYEGEFTTYNWSET